jgi:hypothetical protein
MRITKSDDIKVLISIMEGIRDLRFEFKNSYGLEQKELHSRLASLYSQIDPDANIECLTALLDLLALVPKQRKK